MNRVHPLSPRPLPNQTSFEGRTVSLLFAPSPGDYLLTDAHRTLVLGGTQPDAFGMTLAAGDIDGDGLGDLAIGAPRDSAAGEDAGSVTIVFGASL